MIYNALGCLSDGKKEVDVFSVKKSADDRYPALMIRSALGIAFILPFLGEDNIEKNVDFKNYIDFEKSLDEKAIQAEKAKWTA